MLTSRLATLVVGIVVGAACLHGGGAQPSATQVTADVCAGSPRLWADKSAGLHEYGLLRAAASFGGQYVVARSGKVLRMAPGWGEWQPFGAGLEGIDVLDLAVHRGFLYAATYGGVYRVASGGSTWTLRSGGLPTDTSGRPKVVEYLRLVGNSLLALVRTDDRYVVHVSDDQGSTWTSRGGGLAVAQVLSLTATPVELMAATASDGVWTSPDGAIWTREPLDAGVRRVNAIAQVGRRSFAATEAQGIYSRAQQGAPWVKVEPAGVGGFERRSLAAVGTRLYAGLGYRGVHFTDDDGRTWIQYASGLPTSPEPGGQPAYNVIDSLLEVRGVLFAATGVGSPGGYIFVSPPPCSACEVGEVCCGGTCVNPKVEALADPNQRGAGRPCWPCAQGKCRGGYCWTGSAPETPVPRCEPPGASCAVDEDCCSAACVQERCVSVCVPSCFGKTCGADDGCGGQCGSGACDAPESCTLLPEIRRYHCQQRCVEDQDCCAGGHSQDVHAGRYCCGPLLGTRVCVLPNPGVVCPIYPHPICKG